MPKPSREQSDSRIEARRAIESAEFRLKWLEQRYQVCFIERASDIMHLLNQSDTFSSATPVGGYCFVVYDDLLGIHGRGKTESNFDRRWGPIFRLTAKASVGLVYWVLVLISAVVALHILTSGPVAASK